MVYTSTQLKALDIESILHPMSSIGLLNHFGPQVMTGGKGVFVEDSDGNQFLSADAGLGATTLGFGRQELGEVMLEACKNMGFYQTSVDSSNPTQILLAQKLLNYMPDNITKVFFASSGSEANETAIKILRLYNVGQGKPQKKQIITQDFSYHGSTMFTSALTGMEGFQNDFVIDRQDIISVPCPVFFSETSDASIEEAFVNKLIEILRYRIEEVGADNIAAFMAEPVLGCAGIVIPPKGYYDKVQALLKEYDILFVCDEVLCGYGRTGKMFGYQHTQLQPDIITSAKGLTSGYFPLSCVAISQDIWQVLSVQHNNFGVFSHGFTSCGHPVGAAVALKTLEILEEENLVENARLRGEQLLTGLKEELNDNPYVGSIRGQGLMVGIEIKVDQQEIKDFNDFEKNLLSQTERACLDAGLLVRTARLSNSNFMVPPLTISSAETELLISRYVKGVETAIKNYDRI